MSQNGDGILLHGLFANVCVRDFFLVTAMHDSVALSKLQIWF